MRLWMSGSLALGLILIAALACSDEPAPAATAEPATEAGLIAAATQNAEDIWYGNTRAAYRILSRDCRDTTTYEAYARELAASALALEAYTRVRLRDLTVTVVQVRNLQPLAGETFIEARARGDLPTDLGDPGWHGWLYEEGAWRSTQCTFLRPGTQR